MISQKSHNTTLPSSTGYIDKAAQDLLSSKSSVEGSRDGPYFGRFSCRRSKGRQL
jgi:hypothetical protein